MWGGCVGAVMLAWVVGVVVGGCGMGGCCPRLHSSGACRGVRSITSLRMALHGVSLTPGPHPMCADTHCHCTEQASSTKLLPMPSCTVHRTPSDQGSSAFLASRLSPQLPPPAPSCPHRTYNLTSSSMLLGSLWRANDWKPTDTWSGQGGYATSLVSSGLDMDAIEPAFGNGFRWVQVAAAAAVPAGPASVM